MADMPMAMSAHVVYEAIDPDAPATTSAVVIGTVIRNLIGFDGLLITDDVSMKALSGDFSARASGAERPAATSSCTATRHGRDARRDRGAGALDGAARRGPTPRWRESPSPSRFDVEAGRARLDVALQGGAA